MPKGKVLSLQGATTGISIPYTRRREVLQGKGVLSRSRRSTAGQEFLPGPCSVLTMRYWFWIGCVCAAAARCRVIYPQHLVLEIVNVNSGQMLLCAEMADGEEFVSRSSIGEQAPGL